MCNVVLISCFLDNVRKNKCSTEYNPCVFQVCVAFFRHRWRFAGAENTTSLAQYCSSLVIHSCQTEAVLSRFGVCYTHQLSENSVPSLRFFDSVTTTLISSGSTLTPTQPVLSHLPSEGASILARTACVKGLVRVYTHYRKIYLLKACLRP